MKKTYIIISISLFLFSSCKEKNNDEKEKINNAVQKALDSIQSLKKKDSSTSIIEKEETMIHTNKNDEGEVWLKNIFKMKTSNKYFPDYNVEDKLCTKRYQEFISESGEIYGPSNLDGSEWKTAEEKYKEKWSKIYPITEDEMWLFGRGNGDGGELKDLRIIKISNLKYEVYIDYGDDIKTKNIVTLVNDNGSFKIKLNI